MPRAMSFAAGFFAAMSVSMFVSGYTGPAVCDASACVLLLARVRERKEEP